MTGSAGGVSFGDTAYVYWGARYVIISAIEVECTGLPWVEQNYDAESSPTDVDTSILQFTFAGELIETGKFTIAQGAQVQATVVNIEGGLFKETNAVSGTFDLDSVEEEGLATGAFEAVAFDDGTLDGSFTAIWCRNLKP